MALEAGVNALTIASARDKLPALNIVDAPRGRLFLPEK
jgi:hypothetical protein